MIESIIELSGSSPRRSIPADDWASFAAIQFLRFAHTPRLTTLSMHGGFSGARLWRCQVDGREYCLRAWPRYVTSEFLRKLHPLIKKARAAGHVFVPDVLSTRSGVTWVECDGQFWELAHWMPGDADFLERPSAERLRAACAALAQVHCVWESDQVAGAPCPAVVRRLEAAADWLSAIRSGFTPAVGISDDPLSELTERAWRLLPSRLSELPRILKAWQKRSFKLQPCHCDPWHAHILFTGHAVTGIIDYGSVKQDHVAVDLARLLGDCARENQSLWDAGFDAYCRVRPLSLEEQALVRVLDRSGVVCGVANWLKWLYRDGRVFENREEAARRMRALVERMEAW